MSVTGTVTPPAAAGAPDVAGRFAEQWRQFFANVGDASRRSLEYRWRQPDANRVQFIRDVREAVGAITNDDYVDWLRAFVERRLSDAPYREMEIRHLTTEMVVFNTGYEQRTPPDWRKGYAPPSEAQDDTGKVVADDSGVDQARNIKESLEMLMDDLRKASIIPDWRDFFPGVGRQKKKDRENTGFFGAVGRYLNEVLKMIGGGS